MGVNAKRPLSTAGRMSLGVPQPPPPPLLAPPSRRLRTADALSAARLLAEDFSTASAQVVEVWQRLLGALLRAPDCVTGMLRVAWERHSLEHWSASIFREVFPTSDAAMASDREIWITHGRLSAAHRKSPKYLQLQPHPIEELQTSLLQSAQPILFEQRYVSAPASADGGGAAEDVAASDPGGGSAGATNSARQSGLGVHVLVFVHGLLGNSFDMRQIKNNIALLYPRALYLCSTANEEDTEGDIEQMGANLAEEVTGFVEDWCPGPPEQSLGRLSFITFSIGGLIVRSALPLLARYRNNMYTFLSISCPHLGYLYTSNTLFMTGLWLYKKFHKSKCLEQLSMTDTEEREYSFLSRLARAPGLEFFKHVALASSYQDQWVPFESTRIEISNSAESDPKRGPLFTKLAHSILARVPVERLLRFDVNFQILETNLDTMIGRSSHIQFLECEQLMKMFVHAYGYLFE